jgi:hypothetical protein
MATVELILVRPQNKTARDEEMLGVQSNTKNHKAPNQRAPETQKGPPQGYSWADFLFRVPSPVRG